ncbi:unnamed protein product [Amoebophrya sp. A25]|nr:unnamed protein product [Amoebophrya sp. A25]|eukprot:GSA25T00005852001.1
MMVEEEFEVESGLLRHQANALPSPPAGETGDAVRSNPARRLAAQAPEVKQHFESEADSSRMRRSDQDEEQGQGNAAAGNQEEDLAGVSHEKRTRSTLETNDGQQASRCFPPRNQRTNNSPVPHGKHELWGHSRNPQDDESLHLPLPNWSNSPTYKAIIKDIKFERHDMCHNSPAVAGRAPLLGDLRPRSTADVQEWADHMPHSLKGEPLVSPYNFKIKEEEANHAQYGGGSNEEKGTETNSFQFKTYPTIKQCMEANEVKGASLRRLRDAEDSSEEAFDYELYESILNQER